MKRASLNFLAAAGLSLGLFAFGSIKEGGIQGKVTPSEGAKEVVAIAGTDTLRAQMNNGDFVFSNVKKALILFGLKPMHPIKMLQ